MSIDEARQQRRALHIDDRCIIWHDAFNAEDVIFFDDDCLLPIEDLRVRDNGGIVHWCFFL